MPIGARKCAQQTVVCSSPSVNKTPMGNATPPIPYPVQCTLSSANAVSSNVFFNGNEVFTMGSDTNHVVGDAAGSVGGDSSGTTSKEAEPINHSKTVMVNKKEVIRCGDTFDMNAKNTKGTLTCSPPPKAPPITDEGKIETEEKEPIEEEVEEEKGFFDSFWDKAEESWEDAKEFAGDVSQKAQEINEEYKITARLDGSTDVVAGAVGTVVGVIGVFAPEPITSVGGAALTVVSVDTLQSGARQVWTGESTDSLIAQGVEAGATGLGASPETAETIKDVAGVIRNPGKILTKGGDIVEGAVDMAKKDNKNDKKETKNETKEDKSNNVAIKGDCKNKKGRK